MKHADLKRLSGILAEHYPDANAQPNVFDERYRSCVEHGVHELSHAAVFGFELKPNPRISSKITQRFDDMEGLPADNAEIRTLAVEQLALSYLGWDLSPKRRQMLVGSAYSVARHYEKWNHWRVRVVSALRQPRNKALARKVAKQLLALGF